MNKKAFTLIELLVAIVIIGVVSSIAITIYKRSVYKSKYGTLMSLARTVANANEIHYVTHNRYSDDPEYLDITLPNNSEGPNLQLVHDDHSSFVMVSRSDLPNNKYVLYQQHSENFPSESHCEAAINDKDANWLCEQSLQGRLISGSVTPNFNTYIISGNGNGTMNGLPEILANIKCGENESSGSKSCDIIINDYSSITKVSCNDKNNPATCSYNTYTDTGAQSTCYGNSANYLEGECVPNKKGSYMKSYDEEGNVTNYNCNAYTEGSGCATFNEEQYDPNGRHLAAQNRYCVEWNSQGECVRYKQNSGNDHIGIFSENHKQWIRADCKVVETNGICTSYKGGRIEDWDYDENGKTLFYYDNTCSSLSNDLVCSSYSNYKTTTYSYNDTGRTESLCESSVGVNTNCKNITTKTYNSAGKQTSGTVYTCNQWDSNGNCSQYKTGEDHTFTYTTNNKEISHIKNSCSSYDSQNNCLQYSPVSNSYNTYTTNGKTQTSKTTAICNQYTATTCTGGWTVTYIPYVNGKENTSGQTISTCQNFNQSAGECLDQQ